MRVETNTREIEYQTIRKFLRVVNAGEGRLARNLSLALDSELTARQRTAVRYYYMEQMTMQEVARQMNVCVSTVSRTLERARKRLRRCLKYGGQALLGSFLDD